MHEPFDENMPFIEILKSVLIEENGISEVRAVRLIAAHPKIVVQGILLGRTSAQATAKALIQMDSEIGVLRSPGEERAGELTTMR